MRTVFTTLAAAFLVGAVSAQEPPLDFSSFDRRLTALEQRVASLEQARPASAVPAPVRSQPQPYVIPPGMHAHRAVDGRTIVHSDASYGDPVAHAGVARPWVVTARAGQTVYLNQPAASQATQSVLTSSQFYSSSGSGCVGGNCPASSTYRFAPFGGRFRIR